MGRLNRFDLILFIFKCFYHSNNHDDELDQGEEVGGDHASHKEVDPPKLDVLVYWEVLFRRWRRCSDYQAYQQESFDTNEPNSLSGELEEWNESELEEVGEDSGQYESDLSEVEDYQHDKG